MAGVTNAGRPGSAFVPGQTRRALGLGQRKRAVVRRTALGVPRATELLQPLALHAAVSFFLLALHLYLALRFGPGVTLGVGVAFTLLALILGGTGLGETLWPFIPWAWGWLPLTTGATLPFALLALGASAALSWLGAYTAGRLEAVTVSA